MQSFLGSILMWIFKIYINCLGVIVKTLWRSSTYLFHEGFKFLGGAISSKNLLILGPGEALSPTTRFQELFDYSQTAHRKDVERLCDPSTDVGFWLGRQISFRRSSAKQVHQDVWLPAEFLHQHILIVGPTGSGKTELLMKSAERLMSQGNLVCVDAAGFLGDKLAYAASKSGSKLLSWDISNSRNRVVWNFLEELEKFGSPKTIRAIAEALYGQFDTDGDNSSFWDRDIMWLTAILGVAVEARRQKILPIEPSNLPSLIMDRQAIDALLSNLPAAESQWGSDLISYLKLPDDRFALDISFLYKKLSPLKDPDVRLICDGPSQIFLLPAFNGKFRHTLVIGQSLADGKFGSALASMMVSYIMNVMFRRMKQPSHSWTPTYFICDEAPRLKNIDYEELTAIGRNAIAIRPDC